MDLKLNKSKDQRTFIKIMKQLAEANSEGNLIVMKEKAVDYFTRPGFLDMNGTEMHQNEQDSVVIGLTNQPPLSSSMRQHTTSESQRNMLGETGSFFLQGSGIGDQIRSHDLKKSQDMKG